MVQNLRLGSNVKRMLEALKKDIKKVGTEFRVAKWNKSNWLKVIRLFLFCLISGPGLFQFASFSVPALLHTSTSINTQELDTPCNLSTFLTNFTVMSEEQAPQSYSVRHSCESCR